MAPNPLGRARYCDACGNPLTAPESRAEFKQVTVLFADVVGSMGIAAAVGAERLREIMAGLVDHGTAVVHRYGGAMDGFTGDGLMAVFGAPVALEDHALRACLAALNMQTQRLADEVRCRDGIELQLRVWLNSGQVVAGQIGSGVPGYTAVGEQVGLAQRMESMAPPGGVMLSESTAHLVENSAVLADPELVRIKGHDEPVGDGSWGRGGVDSLRVPRQRCSVPCGYAPAARGHRCDRPRQRGRAPASGNEFPMPTHRI